MHAGRSTGENAGAERAVSKQGRRPRMDGELNTSLADRCSRASPSSSNERERRGTSSGNGCAWEAPRRQLWREGAIRLAKAPAACHSSKRLIFGSAQKSQPVTFSERRLVPFSPGVKHECPGLDLLRLFSQFLSSHQSAARDQGCNGPVRYACRSRFPGGVKCAGLSAFRSMVPAQRGPEACRGHVHGGRAGSGVPGVQGERTGRV